MSAPEQPSEPLAFVPLDSNHDHDLVMNCWDGCPGWEGPPQLPRCVDCGRPMPTGRCTLGDCFSTWGTSSKWIV